MELTNKQIELLMRINLAILATADLVGKPRVVIVEINKAEGNRLIITDNEMGATKENLLANKNVFLLAFESDYSYCLKISGHAEYFSEGANFEFVKNLGTNKGRQPKGAIVITIDFISEFN